MHQKTKQQLQQKRENQRKQRVSFALSECRSVAFVTQHASQQKQHKTHHSRTKKNRAGAQTEAWGVVLLGIRGFFKCCRVRTTFQADFISALSVNTSHSLVFKQNRVFHKSYLFWYLDKCLTQKKMHENAWCWRNSEGVRHAQGNENCLCQFNQFLLLLHFIILSINLLLLGVKWVQITHVSGQVCLC